MDKPGFTRYLMRTWAAGGVAEVRTPMYERDNIPVNRLAEEYRTACGDLLKDPPDPWRESEPSGYCESQGAFANRFSRELRSRLNWECRVSLLEQIEFPEPLVRQNRGVQSMIIWDEEAFWNEMAAEAEMERLQLT